MATKEKEGEAKSGGGGLKKIIIIVVALILSLTLLGGGVIAYLIFSKKPHAEKKEEKPKEEERVSFIPLDSFTVNIAPSKEPAGADPAQQALIKKMGPERFVQVFVTVAVTDPKTEEPIKSRIPLLRDRVLKIIAKKTAEELLSPEGKEQLAKDILATVQETVPEAHRKSVKEVLFTNFIVQ